MAHPWHDLPNDESHSDDWFNAVIEIPKATKVKYELDKPSGLLKVDRILASSVVYPINYGMIPRSFCGDGDPLDVLVVGEQALQPLCIVRVRAIGVLIMEDGGADEKILAVNIHDPEYRDVREATELRPHYLKEIQRFFLDYKILEGKQPKVDDFKDAAAARKVVRDCLASYRANERKLRGWS